MIIECFKYFGLKLFFIPKEGGCCVTNVCTLYHDDVFPLDHVIMCTSEFDLFNQECTTKQAPLRRLWKLNFGLKIQPNA